MKGERWEMQFGSTLYHTGHRLSLEMQRDAMLIASPKALDLKIRTTTPGLLRMYKEATDLHVVNIDEER